MNDSTNMRAVPGFPIEEFPAEGVWRVYYLGDREQPLSPDFSQRQVLAVCSREQDADWIRRALQFWVTPDAGQEPSKLRRAPITPIS